ncbi:hypothetical protein [Nonomuraea sp. NPDC001699]
MHRLLLAPTVAALAASAMLAVAPYAAAQAAAPLLDCTDARTGAPVACPDLTEGGRSIFDRLRPHIYCPPEGCGSAGPYDPALARPSVLEWQDPYNPGANTR